MFNVTISGHIGSLTPKTTNSGKQLLTMRIGVSYQHKDRNGAKVKMTQWCECTAWENAIPFWEQYKVGDAVEITGRAHVETYMSTKTGQPESTIVISGLEGSTPSVRWTPGSGKKDDDNGGGNDPWNANNNRGNSRYAAPQQSNNDDNLGF